MSGLAMRTRPVLRTLAVLLCLALLSACSVKRMLGIGPPRPSVRASATSMKVRAAPRQATVAPGGTASAESPSGVEGVSRPGPDQSLARAPGQAAAWPVAGQSLQSAVEVLSLPP